MILGKISGDRRIWIGWESNWEYANSEPTSPWRTIIPREVSVAWRNGKLALFQRIVPEHFHSKSSIIQDLIISEHKMAAVEFDAKLASLDVGRSYWMKFQVDIEDCSAVEDLVGKSDRKDEMTMIGFQVVPNTKQVEVYFDRIWNDKFPI